MSDQHWGNYEIIKQDHDTITTMGISHISSHLRTQRGNNSKSGRKRNLIRADWKARHMVHRNFCFQLKHPPPPRQTKYKLKQTILWHVYAKPRQAWQKICVEAAPYTMCNYNPSSARNTILSLYYTSIYSSLSSLHVTICFPHITETHSTHIPKISLKVWADKERGRKS